MERDRWKKKTSDKDYRKRKEQVQKSISDEEITDVICL